MGEASIGTWVAAFLTLSIFSFLYRDNPFYRFAEHLMVGISMGYAIPLVYDVVFLPFVYKPIFLLHDYVMIFPTIVGILYLFRFSRKLVWLSRYPMVFFMGISGMGVVTSMNGSILVQLRSAMVPLESINLALIFIGTVSIIMYFYFSKSHTGLYGKFTRIGIWYMMIGFGASFGYTVMARISLLIGRIQFLVIEWLGFQP